MTELERDMRGPGNKRNLLSSLLYKLLIMIQFLTHLHLYYITCFVAAAFEEHRCANPPGALKCFEYCRISQNGTRHLCLIIPQRV